MARTPRTSRAAETRAAGARPDPQANFQSTLYFPQKLWPKGMTCRFIRVAVDAQPDNARWAQAHMQGWQPMTLEEAPGYSIPNPDGSMPTGGIVRIANQILCKKPTALVRKDQEAQQAETQNQMAYLDDYVSDNPDAGVINRFSYSGPTEIRASRAGPFKD